MTGEDAPGGPLDVPTLEILSERGRSHPLVSECRFEPDSISPRELVVSLDAAQYPGAVDTARIDVRWFEGGAYSLHYVETRESDRWECRWDRHTKPDAPRAHFHPPPDASQRVSDSTLADTHHLDVFFDVLEWVTARVESLHAP